MIRFFTTLSLLVVLNSLFSQKASFQGTLLKKANFPELEYQFNQWEVYQFDVQMFDNYVKNAGSGMELSLQFGSKNWDIWLTPRDIRGANYVRSVLTENGVKTLPKGENITFKGYLPDAEGSAVALTIDHDFLYGFIKKEEEFYLIEPLWYFVPDQPKDRFVIYAASDVKPRPDLKCGLDEMEKYLKNHEGNDHKPKLNLPVEKVGNCYELELAIASDKSMYNKYGSVAGVEAHNIGVINNVQTNYDNEFPDEVQFLIVQQFVVVPPANDPWTNSTDASVLLNDFTDWGPTGFSATHDLGELWTNRNFDGGTVGIAWLSSVCTSLRYHCLQDFTSNANLLRVMTAHEIGHNCSATHDPAGSPHIMAPTVQNTNTWSSQSVNQIGGYIPTRWCLSFCPGAAPPVAAFSGNPTSGCAPLTVSFSDQSSNSPTTWSWTFPGGTPGTSTLQNPTVVYSLPGTYDVTLTVSNGLGSNTLTLTNYISASAAPTANFTYNQIGTTLVFINTSSANATSFLWDFGDGSTSTEVNPVHTYIGEGFYTVTLTAFNSCGPNVFPINIPVFTPPTAAFGANPTSGCASLQVNYSNQSTPNVTNWSWSFPGGTPSSSTNPNPTVTYSSPGTYSATLTVTNPAGSNTVTQTNIVTVGTIPTPGFSFTVNGNTATFTNTTSNANGIGNVTYQWNFGDGNTSTQANPTHTYSTNGTYTVTLTATNTCGPATVSHTVTIVVPPTAGFSATPTSGCAVLTVNFSSASSVGASSYNWSFPGGSPSSSTAQNPSITYNNAGTYNVTLVVSNSAGSDTLTLTNYITVNPQATSSFTKSVNNATVTFTNTSTHATSYLWNFGDGSTSTQMNPVHTYAQDGTYTVTLEATNDCGTATSSQSVVIVTPPTAAFSANVTSGCAPLTVQFSNQSSANATSYAWLFPGGSPTSSTEPSPTVTYNSAGTYTVTLTVSNAAGSNTATQTNYITVNTTPTAGFTFNTNYAVVTFNNTSGNATSYSWNFGDGGTSTDASPSHTYTQDGTYTVTLSATNACGTVTATQSVTIVSLPNAAFSATGTTGCSLLTVQFDNQSSANATFFNWQFPGGNPGTSTAQNPTVTYATPGSYDVTLIVSNSAGSDTTTLTNFVVVNGPPSAGFTVSTNVFVANFTNTTPNGTSYSWNFGDGGTSNQVNPSHTYSADGTYSVTLTATNNCGTNNFTQDVLVTSLPQAAFSANVTTGCEPFTVQFQDQSSSNTTAWNWSFPGGNPSSSTAQNPSVTYNAVGTYTVTLTASNALGQNTATQTNYITVNSEPMAGFTQTTSLLTATFTNTSAGATNYSWNFGDGQTNTASNPTHTYAQDGTYTVTLTATNPCGSVTVSQSVTVVSMPTAGFSASLTEGCAPFTIQFTNESSANATTFQWSFPGGTPSSSTAANPSVTYSSAGVYNVTLTVSNAAGSNTVTQTDLVVVNAVPDAAFSGTVNEASVSFSNNTSNANSYDWDFGDGETSTEANPTHTYQEDGVYEVTLTATNDCGSVTVSEAFTIVTPPTAGFTAMQTSGCQPFVVQFSNESSANATTFSWQFPGGTPSVSSDQNPVVTYDAPGVYDVTLAVSNAAGNDTQTLNSYISVLAMPAPGFSFVQNDLQVDFSNSSVNANSFLWNFGDGQTSTEEKPSHLYAGDGAYTVTLTATNDCGSVSISKLVVIATQGPVAAFSTETTNGCAPFQVTFSNLSSPNAANFLWDFPGGTPSTSTEENPTVVYNAPGTYDVMLTASNIQGSNTYTETAYIVVGSVPNAGFTASVNMGTVNFTNSSSSASEYSWDFGDGQTSNEQNPVHTYQASGEYTVTMTAKNDCGFATATQIVTVMLTAVEEIPGISEFNVFPNPNSGRFTLALSGEPQNMLDLSFTNLLGQRLLFEEADFRTGQMKKEFTFDQLPAGMYIFQVKSGRQAIFKKVIVE